MVKKNIKYISVTKCIHSRLFFFFISTFFYSWFHASVKVIQIKHPLLLSICPCLLCVVNHRRKVVANSQRPTQALPLQGMLRFCDESVMKLTSFNE